jgi:hypothetical protein
MANVNNDRPSVCPPEEEYEATRRGEFEEEEAGRSSSCIQSGASPHL